MFFLKSPGHDAYLFDDGTTIRRFGFGDQKHLNRYGGFAKAYERLTEEGYRPYGIFNPGVRDNYENEHVMALKRVEDSRRTFAPAPDIKKIGVQEKMGHQNVQLPQSRMYNDIRTSRPIQKTKQGQENRSWFTDIDNLNKQFREPELKIKVMNFGEYLTWNDKMMAPIEKRKNKMFKGLGQPRSIGAQSSSKGKTKEELMDKIIADRARQKTKSMNKAFENLLRKEAEEGIL